MSISQKTLYQNIKSQLKVHEKLLKVAKYNRPYRYRSEGYLEYRKLLNSVRFLNAYLYFVKYDGQRPPTPLKKEFSGFPRLSGRNMYSVMSGFVGFSNNNTVFEIKRSINYLAEPRVSVQSGLSMFEEIDYIADLIKSLHEEKEADKYDFFSDKIKELRNWFCEIHTYFNSSTFSS